MVIKPDALYNLCKKCPDSKWVGDIVRRLCGQEVELDFGQTQSYEIVRDDCIAFERRMDEIRARDAKRKAAYRARKDADNAGHRGTDGTGAKSANATDVPSCPMGQDGTTRDTVGQSAELSTKVDKLSTRKPENVDNRGTDACPTPTYHPTTHPSLPPSTLPSTHPVGVCANTAPARTRGDVPDEATVVATATSSMGVGAAYARWWWREMEARGWRNTDGSRIGHDNWRPTLKAWRNRATERELAEIEAEERKRAAARPRAWRPEDWLLCAERCANFRDGRCAGGCITPPDRRPRPIPPEECQHYRANGAGK